MLGVVGDPGATSLADVGLPAVRRIACNFSSGDALLDTALLGLLDAALLDDSPWFLELPPLLLEGGVEPLLLEGGVERMLVAAGETSFLGNVIGTPMVRPSAADLSVPAAKGVSAATTPGSTLYRAASSLSALPTQLSSTTRK